jgi:hypothetical protein
MTATVAACAIQVPVAAQPGDQPAASSPAAAAQPAAPLDAAAVVAEVRRILGETYVLPERRPALDAVLAEGMRSGRYAVREPAVLAERINADLARVGQDHHLYIGYNPQRVAMMMARTPENQPDRRGIEDQARRANHGVRELKVLPGNVRYLDLASFDWAGEESEKVLNAAMAFLKDGDAVIIDLRRNGGGSGQAVHQLISHFLEADRPLITFYRGSEASPTFKSLAGLSTMVGKPLYVLTSGGTGSAAEEFAGHVAGYRIGEVVGAATSGAAYMNNVFAIQPGFELSVSVARPVLAATGKDWERVGIVPTISAPVEAALQTAHVHALRRLARENQPRRGQLEAMAGGIEAAARPATPASPLRAYTGVYGDRRISLEEGRLWYQQEARPRRLMVPLGGHRFTLADDPLIRLSFRAERSRVTGFDVGPADGPVQGRYERQR